MTTGVIDKNGIESRDALSYALRKDMSDSERGLICGGVYNI